MLVDRPNANFLSALSSLQYKNAYDTNVYRPGDLNLPRRMAGILSMSPAPDFVEVITWVRNNLSYDFEIVSNIHYCRTMVPRVITLATYGLNRTPMLYLKSTLLQVLLRTLRGNH